MLRPWSQRGDGGGAFASSDLGQDGGDGDCATGSAFRVYRRDFLRNLLANVEARALSYPPRAAPVSLAEFHVHAMRYGHENLELDYDP